MLSEQAPSSARDVVCPGQASEGAVELTILMPCLNEAETLATCIEKAQKFLRRAETSGEVLIADNGSTDGSQEIARNWGARVITVAERGYGAALLGGMASARGRYVIMGDADDSYNFEELDGFLTELRAGAELVIGNRFSGGIAPGAMPFLHRYVGNPVLSVLGRLLFRAAVGDFHCGLRAFRTEAIRQLNLRTSGMEFASEMVVRSALSGLRITEVPTALRPDGRSRRPHLKTWSDGWRHLKFLLMYTPRWLFMAPGALLLGMGTLLGALLFRGPLWVTESIGLDLSSFIFGCFLAFLGAQLLTFGALARYYAAITGFLPSGPRALRLERFATTEKFILLSLILLLIGLGLFGYAVGFWADVGFGPIHNSIIPRAVVAGMTFVALAVQTFFAGFLFGILAIPATRTKA
ncbi:MAG: glycosyltransferase family 2 protein [Xanthobacteraceae bacterium]